MAQTEAQARAVSKYHSKFNDIKIRVLNDGTREKYQAHAQAQNKSLNAYIIELIEKDMQASKQAP